MAFDYEDDLLSEKDLDEVVEQLQDKSIEHKVDRILQLLEEIRAKLFKPDNEG